MVSPAQNTMNTFFCKLISCKDAAVTENTTGHVQLNVWPKVVFVKRPALEFVTCPLFAMLITKILKVTFPGLIAHRAIEGMIKE